MAREEIQPRKNLLTYNQAFKATCVFTGLVAASLFLGPKIVNGNYTHESKFNHNYKVEAPISVKYDGNPYTILSFDEKKGGLENILTVRNENSGEIIKYTDFDNDLNLDMVQVYDSKGRKLLSTYMRDDPNDPNGTNVVESAEAGFDKFLNKAYSVNLGSLPSGNGE